MVTLETVEELAAVEESLKEIVLDHTIPEKDVSILSFIKMQLSEMVARWRFLR